VAHVDDIRSRIVASGHADARTRRLGGGREEVVATAGAEEQEAPPFGQESVDPAQPMFNVQR
jgi:hypothetical protein